MKSWIKRLLHALLGFERYLYVFAIFKINTFKWDKKEGDFFQFLALLKADDTVLDIGSNIGITTVLMSKKVSKGKVFSYEPIPINFTTLTKISQRYRCDNAQLFQFALGNETGTVDMVLPEVKNVRMQGLSHVVHEDLTDFNDGKRYQSAIYTLDNRAELQDLDVAGIKIDVENFEYFALKGGENLLKRCRPIVYAELWDNENRQRCFDLMQSLGYAIRVHQKGHLVTFDTALHDVQNFFFVWEG